MTPQPMLPRSTGNIAEFDELPTVRQLRLLIHSRLREYIAAHRKLKTLAIKAGLHPTTVSRAAYNVSQATHIGTVHKLAPHLGIKLDARLVEGWKP